MTFINDNDKNRSSTDIAPARNLDAWSITMRCDEPQQDYTTREGAQALAARIVEYWRDRGYEVMLQIEDVGFHPAIRAARYEIRSDLINGLPRPAFAISQAA